MLPLQRHLVLKQERLNMLAEIYVLRERVPSMGRNMWESPLF